MKTLRRVLAAAFSIAVMCTPLCVRGQVQEESGFIRNRILKDRLDAIGQLTGADTVGASTNRRLEQAYDDALRESEEYHQGVGEGPVDPERSKALIGKILDKAERYTRHRVEWIDLMADRVRQVLGLDIEYLRTPGPSKDDRDRAEQDDRVERFLLLADDFVHYSGTLAGSPAAEEIAAGIRADLEDLAKEINDEPGRDDDADTRAFLYADVDRLLDRLGELAQARNSALTQWNQIRQDTQSAVTDVVLVATPETSLGSNYELWGRTRDATQQMRDMSEGLRAADGPDRPDTRQMNILRDKRNQSDREGGTR